MNNDIRPARVEDIPAIAGIWLQNQQDFRETIPAGFGAPMEGPDETSRYSVWLEGAVADANRIALVALRDRVVRGCLIGEIKRGTDDFYHAPYLYIDHLYVDRSARRSGIGRALMQTIEKLSRERGMNAIELAVASRNVPGIRLYESLGYTVLTNRMAKMIR